MSFRRRTKILRRYFQTSDHKISLAFLFLRNWRKGPDELFRRVWRVIDRAPSKYEIEGRFGIPLRHVRHFNLRQLIKHFFPEFSPEVIADIEILQSIRDTPSVVASIHSQTEFAICAALDRAGLRTAFISADPVVQAQIQNYNFSVPPLNILRRADLYVQARAALRSGRTLVCDADFILNKGLPSAQVCISISLFEFRRVLKAELFFAYVKILEDGSMNCVVEAAPEMSSSAVEDGQNFINFIERVEGGPPHLTIRDWPGPVPN